MGVPSELMEYDGLGSTELILMVCQRMLPPGSPNLKVGGDQSTILDRCYAQK